MRAPITITALALTLAACGGNQAANNAAVAEENEASAQFIPTNDVTAIDAAINDAAEMAPDVNYVELEANAATGNEEADSAAAPRKESPAPKPKVATPPAETNTAAPATGNETAPSGDR